MLGGTSLWPCGKVIVVRNLLNGLLWLLLLIDLVTRALHELFKLVLAAPLVLTISHELWSETCHRLTRSNILTWFLVHQRLEGITCSDVGSWRCTNSLIHSIATVWINHSRLFLLAGLPCFPRGEQSMRSAINGVVMVFVGVVAVVWYLHC